MDKQFKRIMQDMSPGGQINSETMTTLTSLYKSRATSYNDNDGSNARNSLFAGGSSSIGGGISLLDEIRSKMEEEGGILPGKYFKSDAVSKCSYRNSDFY